MTQSENSQAFLSLTTAIVSAYLKNNPVGAADLPLLIERVYLALRTAGTPPLQAPAKPAPAVHATELERQTPVVPIKKSVFPDYIICLEDGRKMKTLKRYLRTTYNLTPEQYRDKWGLAAEYPMVAPNYAEHRSALAKQTGLGRKPAAAPLAAAAPEAEPPAQAAAGAHPDSIAETEPPARMTRTDHTLASVFSNFPRPSEDAQDEAEASAEGDERKPRRKPFSKQLARSMRR